MHKLRSERICESKYRVENYAKAVKQSRSTIYRNVKLLMHSTPKHWFNELRLKQAKEMLTNRCKENDICRKLGFCDRVYFWRWFTKRAGISPRAFIQNKIERR